MATREICGECGYWHLCERNDDNEDESKGECRASQPKVVGTAVLAGYKPGKAFFPIMPRIGWCGDIFLGNPKH